MYIAVGLASVALAIVFRRSGLVLLAGVVYVALAAVIPVYWRVIGPTRADVTAAIGRAKAAAA